MKHFVCDGGCQGVAADPGVCMMSSCPKHGLPLKECNCEDGKHEEVMAQSEQVKKEE
jgi:hypothetical protein